MAEQTPNDDDNPTVIRSRSGARTTVDVPMPTMATQRTERTEHTQRTEAAPHQPHTEDTLSLPIGTRLGEFELTHRIGEGGFGIVYKAWDHSLERQVALKEYLPSSIATRIGQTRISCRSERHRETFEAGLKSFINEAKLLARFDHPSLVKVFRFWEANGTAYMVMPFYEGTTMRETVRAMDAPPDEAWLREMLGSLTDALAVIHAEQCYHRDIAPDNVMLLDGSGRPLLLDFGAARRVIGDMTQALTVILKPGYAPVEQYAEVPGMKQGPWTDVYALAAVVYWCITGKTPPPSVGRMLHDSWVPLADAAAGRYSAGFLEAIDRALVVRPELRTQDIDALRRDIGLGPAAVPVGAAVARPVDPDATVIRAPGKVQTTGPRTATTAAATAATAAAAPAVRTTAPVPATAPKTAAPPRAAESVAAAAQPRRDATPPGRAGLVAGVALGVLAVGAGAWWFTRAPAPVPAPTPPVASAPAPAPAPAAVVAAPPPPAAPAPAPVPSRAVPRSPAEAFALWQGQRSAALQPGVRAPATATDARTRISVTAPQAGYFYLVASRVGGHELQLWHPGAAGNPARIEAGAALEIAPAAWAAQWPSAGRWQVMALVTREPWDLAADGWRADGSRLARGFGALPVSASACPPGAGPCGEFGAEEFALEIAAAPPPPVARPAPAPAAVRQAAPATASKPANAEECARIIGQMSLGDTSAALTARFRALGCR